MMRKLNNIWLTYAFRIFLTFLIFQACNSPVRVSSRNLGEIYSRNDYSPEGQFRFFHYSIDTSSLYFRISDSNLLSIKKDDGSQEVSLKISWKLFAGYEARHMLDSSSTLIKHSVFSSQTNDIAGEIHIKIPINQTIICEVKITDLNRQKESLFLIETFKDSLHRNRDNFGLILNNNFELNAQIKESDSFEIQNNFNNGKYLVRYYQREFPLPSPPFSIDRLRSFEYDADSIFTIDLKTDTILCFPAKGFYHIQRDSSDKTGYTLFRFDEDYPLMTNPLSLLLPIRYLSTKKEHENLLMAKNKKSALDEYWINIGGSQERARELIKQFYRRVQDSNRNFSCHTEGWKTDRGLIYIVFGKPNSIYKNANGELWIYGTSGNSLSVSFNFERIKNPFSDNDFVLLRSPSYEMTWYSAVESWRKGRAFNPN